jgi:hypothetical protein
MHIDYVIAHIIYYVTCTPLHNKSSSIQYNKNIMYRKKINVHNKEIAYSITEIMYNKKITRMHNKKKLRCIVKRLRTIKNNVNQTKLMCIIKKNKIQYK